MASEEEQESQTIQESSPTRESVNAAASLLGLFQPPPPATPTTATAPSLNDFITLSNEEDGRRRSTLVSSNSSILSGLSDSRRGEDDATSGEPFSEKPPHYRNELTPLLAHKDDIKRNDFFDFITPKTSGRKHSEKPQLLTRPHMSRASQLPSIREIMPDRFDKNQTKEPIKSILSRTVQSTHNMLSNLLRKTIHESSNPSTWIGALMFLLFHVVFSLTVGAAITRPHATANSLLGAMTKMAALGIMFGPVPYWWGLDSEIPALYPTVDLFAAPFLANIASLVDEEIFRAGESVISSEDNDAVFLATFSTLAVMSIFISGTLLVLASVFKLVNVGAFLPFPVLCGFFSAVGIMMWTLAFKVDNNGLGVGAAIWSGDWNVQQKAIIHHLPTLVVAGIMKYIGPLNPLYVVGAVFGTIGAFYVTMFVFNISRETMIEEGWFWSSDELIYQTKTSVGFSEWAPPAPFGWMNNLVEGKVYWPAVWNAINPAVALGFLYLIRCSLHGAAMKKNVPNMQRAKRETVSSPTRRMSTLDVSSSSLGGVHASAHNHHRRRFSEMIDIEHLAPALSKDGPSTETEKAKPTNISLKDIMIQYGFSQFAAGIVGGFAVTPSVAASGTMYVLRAEHLAPQVGSVIMLVFFYMTNFKLVGYIPKPAFSSLLVLSFINMTLTWMVNSYHKTKEKLEWAVVPLIIVMAFTMGLLHAVFLGIALSTFFFVASFFRSGVVKFMANGVTVRSTIERPVRDANWLDQNGDLIQILVLQNYLFFGNASSIESYICSMFEEPADDVDPIFLPPLPQILVLDLTLVSGMDTSAVDAFSDIIALCNTHSCKVFLAGVSSDLRKVMLLAGVKPETTSDRSKRKLRFFPNLDSAVGKAEDILLENDHSFEPSFARQFGREPGFKVALRMIDEQHETTAMADLRDLQTLAEAIELQPGDELYDKVEDRGLFFIEEGVLKIERSAGATVGRIGGQVFSRFTNSEGTLNEMKARSNSIGRAVAELKAGDALSMKTNFRIARIGPGWIIGSTEALSKLVNPATTLAVTFCRLHYVSFQKIEDLEKDNPTLVLKLYKLLAFLLSKRQEVTIGQLGTLHAIMNAPAQKKPSKRGLPGNSKHGSYLSVSSISKG